MSKKWITLLSLLLLVCVSLPAHAASWKLAHMRPLDSPIERDIQQFAKEVREATDGRVDIKTYGSSQLGDYTVVQERISVGAVEMACQSVSTLVDKRFLSYILPYVATNYEMAKKNYGTGAPYEQYCAALFERQGIKVLANWPAFFGGIGAVKTPPFPTDPDANQKMKMRVPPTKAQEALAEGLGYLATPLPFSEFFTAAQTGMVEGILGGGAETYYSNARDVLKAYIAANTHFENWPLIVSEDAFASLSKEDQQVLIEKAAAFEARRWEQVEAQQQEYEKKLEDLGWTVIYPTQAELDKFAEKGRQASWPELKKAIGPKEYEKLTATFVLK